MKMLALLRQGWNREMWMMMKCRVRRLRWQVTGSSSSTSRRSLLFGMISEIADSEEPIAAGSSKRVENVTIMVESYLASPLVAPEEKPLSYFLTFLDFCQTVN